MKAESGEGSGREMEGVRVRAALRGDVEEILRVDRGAATAPHWQEEEYARVVRGEGAVRRCLLVAEQGRVVGYAMGRMVGEVGEIESVAVEAGWRRRGAGAALCQGVLDWCRGEGAREVELEVRATSEGVRRMYGRLGFCEVGHRRGYYEDPTDDAILMRMEFGGTDR